MGKHCVCNNFPLAGLYGPRVASTSFLSLSLQPRMTVSPSLWIYYATHSTVPKSGSYLAAPRWHLYSRHAHRPIWCITKFYFLRVSLKVEVCKRHPRNLLDLKQAVREEMQRIPQALLEKVAGSFRMRLQQRALSIKVTHSSDIIYFCDQVKNTFLVIE